MIVDCLYSQNNDILMRIDENVKKIMVMEPNPFHGEVIPGVVEYLIKLGYSVDLFVRKELIMDGIASILPSQTKVYEFTLSDLQNLFQKKKNCDYDFLFLTSLEIQIGNEIHSFIRYFNFEVMTKYGVLGIYHTSTFVSQFHDEKMYSDGRIFFLSDFQVENGEGQVLNPHFFNKNACINIKKNRSDKVKIVVLGNICDYRMVGKALSKLTFAERKRIQVIHTGSKNDFKTNIKRLAKKVIVYVCALIDSRFREKKYAMHIIEMGRLNFPDLLKLLDSADYLLMPIDMNTTEGKHYVSVSTSGTKQMSLGMNVPIIANDVVGGIYGFERSNSVFYEKDNLEEAFRSVIDDNSQSDRIENLKKAEEKIYIQSLENLRLAIEKNSYL